MFGLSRFGPPQVLRIGTDEPNPGVVFKYIFAQTGEDLTVFTEELRISTFACRVKNMTRAAIDIVGTVQKCIERLSKLLHPDGRVAPGGNISFSWAGSFALVREFLSPYRWEGVETIFDVMLNLIVASKIRDFDCILCIVVLGEVVEKILFCRCLL